MEDEEDNSTTRTAASTTMSTNLFSSLLVLFLCFTSNSSLLLADDSGTMLTLSRALNGPAGWVGSNPCKWQGVSCDTSGSVTSISLISKSISGQLPPEVNNLSNLKSLSLQQNLIHGSIPPISNLKKLQQVYLDGNRFTSIPSPFFSDLPSLQTLSLGDNPLSPWTIPESLSELTSLQSFRASNASIFGTIPDIFASLPSMKELRLSYNNLTGTLPPSLSGSSIQNLWINNQKVGLSGSLYVLGEMPSLAQVWVHDNALSGAIPDLSKCTQLFDLQLRENQLTGVVPLSLTNLAGLQNVSLQNNVLQGPVPAFRTDVQVNLGTTNSFCLPKTGPCDPQVTVLLEIAEAFGYPREFAESWKGNDACNGWSHVTCDARGKYVTVLNFAKQGLIGTISPAFANLTSLTTIILSDNNLYGKIPDSLTSLQLLQRIDVSNNNLTGKVPDFLDSVKVQTDGNRFLGTNLDTTPRSAAPGMPESSSSRSGSSGTSRSMTSTWVIAGIIVLSLGIVVVLAFIIYYIYLRKRWKDHGLEKGFGKLKGKSQDMKVKRKNEQKGVTSKPDNSTNKIQFYDGGSSVFPIELIREVTDNFNSDNILGRGGFGIVYKGILRDGTQIAVKRMESNAFGTKGISEFDAEIAVLSKVRHRHLVAFLGYCFNGYERIVVYEYMPQGTLGQHLFEWKEMGSSPLTWKQRLAIALDVARGVEYLHSLAQQSFIHRDLKPSNILLANDMRAKVSDFGLVKNAPEGKASVETRLAGTFGYLAPEYAATGRVTTKVDVFAYGVVLMEMITGRKALDESLPEDEAQLVTWFRRVLINKDSIRKSLDPTLEPNEEMYESICKVAELAGHCTAREPTQRPDMSHAVSMLSPLVNEWRPTRSEEEEEEDGNINDVHVSLPQALQRWQHGETTAVSDFSQSQNYLSSAPTTPSGFDDNFDLQGR